MTARSKIHAALIGFLLLSSDSADAIKPSDIYVIDGDLETLGKRIRLVGYDAPELGKHARCGLERMPAAHATSRLLRMIQVSNDIDRKIVDYSWRPGTAGTITAGPAAISQSTGETPATSCSRKIWPTR
jgi:endonuclease YncB( thermonuclease family)